MHFNLKLVNLPNTCTGDHVLRGQGPFREQR